MGVVRLCKGMRVEKGNPGSKKVGDKTPETGGRTGPMGGGDGAGEAMGAKPVRSGSDGRQRAGLQKHLKQRSPFL